MEAIRTLAEYTTELEMEFNTNFTSSRDVKKRSVRRHIKKIKDNFIYIISLVLTIVNRRSSL